MQAAVLRALEFDRIREVLAREALTPLGRTRALELEPATEAAEVEVRLRTTTAAVAFVAGGGSLAIDAPEDLPDTLAALTIEDQPLDPLALVGLARFLTSLETIVVSVRSAGGILAEIAEPAASFEEEAAAIRKAIDPSGDVNDNASPALRDIRDALRRQRAKLRAALDALTRGRDTAKYLQDQIVTDRNGRYVVVVRAEHRDAIAGIVHGSSASGASLYLEPLTTVPLNNDIVALAERERAEVRRILLALTNAFRIRGDELAATVDVASDLDELCAKVRLARRMTGLAPALSNEGGLEFLGARHPLLIPAVRDLQPAVTTSADAPLNPVASDLRLVAPTRALVISGPNTGGKTVALKAVGLLALMAQAGLLIPIEAGSRFTPFRTVFADIGDDQSIAASLSTFSGHIANIVAMDRALELPALVLLDEIGGGTDPVEGGALGAAIVDHFRQRGALVVATTHDDTLKSYAATTAGVATAGFGFNPETYAPSYRLLYGAPGRSLALEIAERLGVPATVITDARSRRSSRESQLAAHLARMDQELAALERERQLAATDRQAAAGEMQRLLERETRLAEREAVLKRRLDQRVNEQLREARAEVDRVVGQLKERAESLSDRAARLVPGRAGGLSTGDSGALRAEARAALSAIGQAVAGPDTTAEVDAAFDEPPAPGQLVFVVPFSTEGIVRSVAGTRVEVDIKGKRMQVPVTALRRRDHRANPADWPTPSSGHRAQVSSTQPPEASSELVLVGSTVDAALDRAAKFLDDALIADARRVRVVHGHGTGRLREALRAFFREHPLVASVAPASDKEGGNGATVVELKDRSPMSLFPQSFLDDLKAQTDIVSVITDATPLKKAGVAWKGLCPFHQEKTPSFSVNRDKGFFKCFGCGVGGDVVKFVELYQKVAFPEAVRLLAQRAGLVVPDTESGPAERAAAAEREALTQLHEQALIFYREQLAAPAGRRALSQLTERGLAPETIATFRYGYAPAGGRDTLQARFASQRVALALQLKSGLVMERDGGQLVDRFRNRLMVPIARESGAVVAFGGRAMDEGQVPKYLNSPETPIYTKGRTLYGLDVTKGAIKKHNYSVLVEGYFDLAQVWQAGVQPVAALCGTAMTGAQARTLKRLAPKVVLSLDPDAAGQGAAARSSELLVAEGFSVNVALLPAGSDPDTFIRRAGALAYRELLTGSRPYLDFLLDRAATGLDLNRQDDRKRFLDSMLTVAATVPDAALRDQFADWLAHKARITESIVRDEIRKAAAEKRTQAPAVAVPAIARLRPAEQGLLWILMHRPVEGLAAVAQLDPEDLEGLMAAPVLRLASSLAEMPPELLPDLVLDRLSEGERALVDRARQAEAPAAPPSDCVNALKRLRVDRERAEVQEQIDQLQAGSHIDDDDSALTRLWTRKQALVRRLEELRG